MLRFVQKTDGQVPQALVDAGIGQRLAQLLYARGVQTPEEAQRYLHPQKEHLHDPMLMQDMDRAVACVRETIARGEEIAIFGDYDVDGVTATSILLTYLKKCGARTRYHIPDRHGEGYGLNKEAIGELAKTARLLITVDCGITCPDEVAFAYEQGMRVIVTDHHQLGPVLPQCEAVLNPLLGDYPFRRLCGAGVAFKLVQALGGMEAIEPLWELAALATVADIVPLMDENRVIVSCGLKMLNETKRPGLLSLIEVAGLTGQKITSGHIGFQLAPRINAGGRLALAAQGVELLTTLSMERARAIAAQLERENTQRRELEMEIFKAADALVQDQIDFLRDRAIVVCGEGWNPGVIGLAASRLVEKYRWPVILLSQDGEICVGSARSIPGVNIHAALVGCGADMFVRFGGHAQAAGMTIRAEKLPAFKETLNRVLRAQTEPDTYVPTEEYDLELELSELTEQLVDGFEALQPTGFGNPSPVFCLRAVTPMDLRRVGKEGAHLKLRLAAGDEVRDAIAFRLGDMAQAMPEKIDVLFSPSINLFRDERTVQCEVRRIIPFSAPRAFLSTLSRETDAFSAAMLATLARSPIQESVQNGVLRCSFLEAERHIRDALSGDIQGTLLIVHSLPGLKKWLTHLAVMGAQLDYTLGEIQDARGFNTLVAMPQWKGAPAAMRHVALLDGAVDEGEITEIAALFPQAKILCVQDTPRFLAETAQEMNATDDELRAVYRTMRMMRDPSASLSVIAQNAQVCRAKCLCALYVFEELGLIAFSRAPWQINLLPMKKCDLTSSRMLMAIRRIAGTQAARS